MTKELMTQRELAQWTGLSVPTVMKWQRKGTLPSIRIGERVYFPKSAVEKYLANVSKST
jgi:excisionase family DNA binding protein